MNEKSKPTKQEINQKSKKITKNKINKNKEKNTKRSKLYKGP